jgi:hypothetical protein
MKKITITPDNPNGIVEDLTAEEVTQAEAQKAKGDELDAQEVADRQAKEELKASAKAKLIAGEALTEDEANTIVL